MPLVIDAEARVSGVLDVYSRESDTFVEGSREAATRFAPYAAFAAGKMKSCASWPRELVRTGQLPRR